MSRRDLILVLTMAAMLTVFYCQWINACGGPTHEFTRPGMWWHIAAASLLLASPGVISRRVWPAALAGVGAWLVMIANILYLRTFGSWIPWGSYAAAGNLADFTGAVIDSLRPADALMPLILAGGLLSAALAPRPHMRLRHMALYAALTATTAAATAWTFNKGEPLGSKLSDLHLNHKFHALAASRYSLSVVTLYEALSTPRLTADNRRRIGRAMKRRVTDLTSANFDNLVVIFMESLEGWPLGLAVEGREITPRLNAMMADPANFSATGLGNDTGTGRSADAQLLLLSGLIPSRNRIYAFAYAGNSYPSVYHALKQRHPDITVRSFTTDHTGIYNIGRLAPQLGVDSLYCWPGAPGAGRKGRRGRRMADGPFFERVAHEVDSAGLWPEGSHKVMQLTTFTCHSPFRTVDGARLNPPEQLPHDLRNYLRVVNYTDSVLGNFIDWLKSKPDYARTLVVIMGDHPAFGSERRKELADHIDAIADESVPLLLLNGGNTPANGPGRQIDVYPTLIRALGLGDYEWHGFGTPINGPRLQRTEHEATLSALILSHNLFGRTHESSPQISESDR
ncbi:MAG: LTA synthase family protein [Muribaculaceae bacterium]|nr:LTA synthase family protein [Muribaculaceae bacterium]